MDPLVPEHFTYVQALDQEGEGGVKNPRFQTRVTREWWGHQLSYENKDKRET